MVFSHCNRCRICHIRIEAFEFDVITGFRWDWLQYRSFTGSCIRCADFRLSCLLSHHHRLYFPLNHDQVDIDGILESLSDRHTYILADLAKGLHLTVRQPIRRPRNSIDLRVRVPNP